jgi:putative transposase
MTLPTIFRCFKNSPEIIRLGVKTYVRRPLSLRNVEDLRHERDVDITHGTVRFWWNKVRQLSGATLAINGASCVQ